MKRTVERELKLQVDGGFTLPPLAGEPLEPRVFLSIYHDTADLRLAHAGVTLRYRVEGEKAVWQCKLPHGASRIELEAEGLADRVPGEILRLLPALTRRRELEQVAQLRTRRAGVRVRENGRPLADVTLDSVAVIEGQRVLRRFEELEVEAVEGADDELVRIADTLRAAGAGERVTLSKLAQTLGVERGDAAAARPRTTGEALTRMLAVQLERIVAHDPGTRLGEDPEDLHQHRVAVRRLRAFLRAARPIVDREWAEGLREELRWLGGELGPVRDADVLLEHLRAELGELDREDRLAFAGLLGRLEREREEHRAELLGALESERYLALLDRLERSVGDVPLTRELPPLALWSREFRRLRRQARRLDADSPDDELHAARIAVKRARYVAELAEPLLGKPASRFVGGAKRLQDVLGEHQDAVVAEERIRRLVASASEPAAHLSAGRLVERQRQRRLRARAAYAATWAELERLGKRLAAA
jgi:CHAD domain-containing protein